MLADGPTNACALTHVIALLVVCCFSVGCMLLSCLIPTLTGLTLIGVSVVVSHAKKRRRFTQAFMVISGYDGGLALQRRRNKARLVTDSRCTGKWRKKNGIPFYG